MSDLVAVCGACHDLDGSVVPAVLDVLRLHPDGSPAEWRWDCPRCGAVVGSGWDGGTLDLEAVRDAVAARPNNDFEVFT